MLVKDDLQSKRITLNSVFRSKIFFLHWKKEIYKNFSQFSHTFGFKRKRVGSRKSHSDMRVNSYRLDWFLYDHYRYTTNSSFHDDSEKELEFTYMVNDNLMTVWSNQDLFGPEPFLAIQENNLFFRDNFTREGSREWCYYFRKPQDVQAFGIAANTPGGKTSVKVVKGELKKQMKG